MNFVLKEGWRWSHAQREASGAVRNIGQQAQVSNCHIDKGGIASNIWDTLEGTDWVRAELTSLLTRKQLFSILLGLTFYWAPAWTDWIDCWLGSVHQLIWWAMSTSHASQQPNIYIWWCQARPTIIYYLLVNQHWLWEGWSRYKTKPMMALYSPQMAGFPGSNGGKNRGWCSQWEQPKGPKSPSSQFQCPGNVAWTGIQVK